MFFQPNRPRTKAILRTPSWEVKHPSRRLYYVRDCERLHHPSSSRDLTAFLDSVKNTPPTLLKKAGGYWLNISHDSTTMQPCKLRGSTFSTKWSKSVQHTPPLFWKKQGEYAPDIFNNSTTIQVLDVYFSCHCSIGLVDLALGLRQWDGELDIVSGFCCWGIGPVISKLGLRPSAILNKTWTLFLDLDAGAFCLSFLSCEFIFDRKPVFLLDLDFGALDLSFWSWAFGPASLLIRSQYHFWTWCWSIGLVLLKLGLRPSSIFDKKSLLFLVLDIGALGLSFWSWAFGSASFLIRSHYCFWIWLLEHWTCHFW